MVGKLGNLLGNEELIKSLKALSLRISGIAVFFLCTLFLTNYFDPVLVGQYEFTRSILSVLGGFVTLGMEHSILYFVGYLASEKRTNELYDIYRKMMLAIFSISAILVIIFLCLPKIWFYSFFEDETSYNLIIKCICILFFYCWTILNTEYFRAHDMIFTSEIFRGLAKYGLIFLIILILYSQDLNEHLVDAYLSSFVLLAIITWYFLYKVQPVSSTKTNFRLKTIVRKSIPMAISSLGFFLLLTIDIIFLKRFHSYQAIAYYAVAIKLILIVSMVLNTINSIYSPQLAEFFATSDKVALNKIIRTSSRLIFLLTLPALILLFIFSGQILSLFGQDYIMAQNALLILMVGHFFSTLCGINGIYLNMTGRQSIFRNIMVLTILINLILNFILIPEFGIEGAAIASSICVVFWNVLALITAYRLDKIILAIH
ncbi:MAG: MATE family efflux transporter [Leeuwenhoekiella sp.]